MLYIQPKRAKEIMTQAAVIQQTVWISGVTGVGKTIFLKKYFRKMSYDYYCAVTCLPEQIEIPKVDGEKHIIIIDDLYGVLESSLQNQYTKIIKQLNTRSDVWLILVSRSSMSQWLSYLCVEQRFLLVREADLLLTRKQQDEFYEKKGVFWSKEAANRIWELGQGNPLFLGICTNEYWKGKEEENTESIVIENGRNQVWGYLEKHVYDQWSTPVQEFLMKMSIVEEFDLDMATAISGDADAGKLLHEAMEVGNFVIPQGDRYRLRIPLCLSMRRRLQREYDAEKRKRLYLRAGDCLNLHGYDLRALAMYEKANDSIRISELLIQNTRKTPTSAHYYDLKNYYLQLPEETIQKSPELMCGMSMLQSMLMNQDESEKWYDKLKEYTENQRGIAKKEALGRLIYLDIALPHRGTMQLVDILKHAVTLISQRKVILSEFSVTSNMPSQMNGGKDFCEWSKKDRELAKTVGKILPLALGRFGKALVNLALAESFFEKGEEHFEVEILTTKGRMEAESSGNIEQEFVAVTLMASMAMMKNYSEYALDLLKGFRKKIGDEMPLLLQNLEALACRIHMYRGEEDQVQEWMKEAPNEHREVFGLERYRYITKIRVYIANCQWEAAENLLRQVIYYGEKNKRTYILMECHLLQAIIYYRKGNKMWERVMQNVIIEAQEYHFVRILSKQGAAIYDMLQKGDFLWENPQFEKQVKLETKQMAKYYPEYLKFEQGEVVRLSENATEILRLQKQGYDIKQIAQKLHISVNTVKYHNSRTYRILGVKGKVQAINEAEKRGLL